MTRRYGRPVDVTTRIPAGVVSFEEWLAMPESTLPVEVVDGVVVMSPAPRGVHQVVVENLLHLLRPQVPSGYRPGAAPRDWVLSEVPVRVRQPDVAVVTDAQARAERLTDPPLLVVEVISPGSHESDFVHKPREYAEAGLRHLWLVDPDTPEVVVRRWDGDAWVEVARASGSTPVKVEEPFPITVTPDDLLK